MAYASTATAAAVDPTHDVIYIDVWGVAKVHYLHLRWPHAAFGARLIGVIPPTKYPVKDHPCRVRPGLAALGAD